jgi:hypothetical protein
MRHRVSWLGADDVLVPPVLLLGDELQPAAAASIAAAAATTRRVLLGRTAGLLSIRDSSRCHEIQGKLIGKFPIR